MIGRVGWDGTMSIITVTKMPECTTHFLWLVEQDREWIWNCEYGYSHEHATIHNSQPMYNHQSRIKNEHEIIIIMSIITPSHMPQYTTHILWFPEQDGGWAWNYQCNHSHNATIYHSPTIVDRVEWRMDMESWTSSESPKYHNTPLTHYNCQSRIGTGNGTMSIITVT